MFLRFYLATIIALLSTHVYAEVSTHFRETYALGTTITGQFKVDSEEKADACYRVLNDETRRLENLLSAYIPDSDVSKLGEHAGEWIEISPDTYEVLNKSIEFARQTHGTFDPTVGAIVKLWSVDQDNHRVPNTQEIANALPYVGFNKIETDIKGGKYFAKIGVKQEITLGAIGKGFISDKVIQKLKAKGCENSLVSLGGNIIASGTNDSNKPWSIGLQSPGEERGDYFAVIPLDNASIVTSGDYEKFFIKDGKKYHHLLNPKNGEPVPATLSSVTIVNKNSAKADALCTALFIMGWDGAIQYLQDHSDLQAVLVNEELTKVAYTQNLEGIIKEVDPQYEVYIIQSNN